LNGTENVGAATFALDVVSVNQSLVLQIDTERLLKIVGNSKAKAHYPWHCVHCNLNFALAARTAYHSVIGIFYEVEAKTSQELSLFRELEALWILTAYMILLKCLRVDRSFRSFELLVVALP